MQDNWEDGVKFIPIVWLVSQASMAITLAQFDGLQKYKMRCARFQKRFPGEAITLGGECFQTK